MLDWIDGNDAMNGLGSSSIKEMGNLPIGTSTYGMWEYVVYVDDLIYSAWMQTAAYNNMGLCGGLILTALASKAIFFPAQLYGQIT